MKNNQVQQFEKLIISSTSRMHVCDLSRPEIELKGGGNPLTMWGRVWKVFARGISLLVGGNLRRSDLLFKPFSKLKATFCKFEHRLKSK